MTKFNRLVKPDCTNVLINGAWHLVKEIHETRKFIKVYGLMGSFQRGHVSKFTNKAV